MRRKLWLCVLIGAAALLSLGAVMNQIEASGDSGVSLDATGITFPDGSTQTTAASGGGELVKQYGSLKIEEGYSCGYEALIHVPADKLLQITWLWADVRSDPRADPVEISLVSWERSDIPLERLFLRLTNQATMSHKPFHEGFGHTRIDVLSEPGKTVDVKACREDTATEVSVEVSIAGRLYDVAP